MKWIYLGLALLLGACATGGSPERASEPLANLPATFSGTLPCADCPGIDYQLNLFEDGAYYMRMRYQNRADGQFDDIGRYLAIQPDLDCEPPFTRAPLALTYWRLTR